MIISNQETGKIVLMLHGCRYSDIRNLLLSEEDACSAVETVTCSLSISNKYSKLCNDIFVNACFIIDKFSIIRYLLWCCQEVRIRQQTHPKEAYIYCKKSLRNGETSLQVLAWSRSLLCKFPQSWTAIQSDRAKALFEEFPVIEKAYMKCLSFRNIMERGRSCDILKIKKELQVWLKAVEDDKINEMLMFKTMVYNNMAFILNYFRYGATNSASYNLNKKIQHLANKHNTKNNKYFLYFLIERELS
ncbi:Transposase [Dysgonomonas macrotermitis]|uniref:Transposase n=1 Tax=Dysgonomonas macrotermitis TaxID=1346286 RepID=A0A1M4X938_9BACT|nr:Transposase [Dysgonomonas macrotermitis]